MIASKDVGVYLGIEDAVFQQVGHQEVVNAPPRIALACFETIGPPAISSLVGMEKTKAVDKAFHR